jgi:hypothetical protein
MERRVGRSSSIFHTPIMVSLSRKCLVMQPILISR